MEKGVDFSGKHNSSEGYSFLLFKITFHIIIVILKPLFLISEKIYKTVLQIKAGSYIRYFENESLDTQHTISLQYVLVYISLQLCYCNRYVLKDMYNLRDLRASHYPVRF